MRSENDTAIIGHLQPMGVFLLNLTVPGEDTSGLSISQNLLHISFPVNDRYDSQRSSINAIDDQIGEHRPEPKLLARTKVFPPVSLARCSDQRMKCSDKSRP